MDGSSIAALSRRATARGLLRRGRGALLDFVLPTDCFGCGRVLRCPQWLGACIACWTDVGRPGPRTCSLCALPRPVSTDLVGPYGTVCATCRLAPPTWRSVRAVTVYDDLARRFLLRAKLGRRAELMAALGRQLAVLLRHNGGIEPGSWLVPVPSHPVADLRRGFSPALELARAVARDSELRLRRRVLKRSWTSWGYTKRLGASARERLLAGSIVCSGRLTDRPVVLIDDVLTSGATAAACSAGLARAGARSVTLMVWARVLPSAWSQSSGSATKP